MPERIAGRESCQSITSFILPDQRMFFGLIALAVVVIASCTAVEEFPPNDAPSGKRSPVGIDAIQGVKSLTSSENEEFIKRAPMGFQGMRGKKDMRQDSEDNLVFDEEYEKRSPMGFHGMRGKKDFLTPDFEDSYFVDDYFKRAPMGFQGMRGKKAITDEDYYKRAAMGFQGMRGKKSPNLIFDEIDNVRYGDGRVKSASMLDYPEEYEKRAPSMGFQGMRGKREQFENELAKRAPMGFQGMRGKKSLLEEMSDLEKRAMMGFQGMRGKKSISSVYYNEYRPERSVAYSGQNKKLSDSKIKRLNMGFVGSRGKRSELDSGSDYSKMSTYELQDALADDIAEDLFLQDDLMNRMNVSPLQFYKRSAYGYSGTRGKKIPRWEIRGKFVGVRGKRLSRANYEDNSDSLNNVHSNNERIDAETGSTIKLDIQ